MDKFMHEVIEELGDRLHMNPKTLPMVMEALYNAVEIAPGIKPLDREALLALLRECGEGCRAVLSMEVSRG